MVRPLDIFHLLMPSNEISGLALSSQDWSICALRSKIEHQILSFTCGRSVTSINQIITRTAVAISSVRNAIFSFYGNMRVWHVSQVSHHDKIKLWITILTNKITPVVKRRNRRSILLALCWTSNTWLTGGKRRHLAWTCLLSNWPRKKFPSYNASTLIWHDILVLKLPAWSWSKKPRLMILKEETARPKIVSTTI